MTARGLDYIPGLIAAYRAGFASDHVHLGYWADGVDAGWPAAQEAMTQLHLDLLQVQDGQAIADIGCGLGGSLRMLNARLGNSELTGINIDPRQLDICRQITPRAGNSLHWMQADATDTGLPTASADRALSVEAMFHFPARLEFFAEMHRILRPGGLLVCSDIHFAAPQTADQRAWLDLVTGGYAPWPQPVVDVTQFQELARAAGLALRQIRDITGQITPTWRHIVSSKDAPLANPQAAMRALHQAGCLRYIVAVMQKPL